MAESGAYSRGIDAYLTGPAAGPVQDAPSAEACARCPFRQDCPDAWGLELQAGMGTTSGLIIPNIFAERGGRARGWPLLEQPGRSFVITDLKGELARTTLAAWARTHRCVVLDVYDPACGVGWNPLAHLATPAQVREFVEYWFKNTGGISSYDKYFDNSTMLLFQAAILHLKEVHRRQAGLSPPWRTCEPSCSRASTGRPG